MLNVAGKEMMIMERKGKKYTGEWFENEVAVTPKQ